MSRKNQEGTSAMQQPTDPHNAAGDHDPHQPLRTSQAPAEVWESHADPAGHNPAEAEQSWNDEWDRGPRTYSTARRATPRRSADRAHQATADAEQRVDAWHANNASWTHDLPDGSLAMVSARWGVLPGVTVIQWTVHTPGRGIRGWKPARFRDDLYNERYGGAFETYSVRGQVHSAPDWSEIDQEFPSVEQQEEAA